MRGRASALRWIGPPTDASPYRSRGGVESLNVAVAAGILLYEVTRGA